MQEGVKEQVGRMREVWKRKMEARANWFYYIDGNEWSCAMEKTKRECKKVAEHCLLTDAKKCILQLMTISGNLYII